MLAGLSRENKAKLNLGDATDYKYLTGGGSVICEGRDDAAEFADIRSAMKVLYVRNKRLGQAFYVNKFKVVNLMHFNHTIYIPVNC